MISVVLAIDLNDAANLAQIGDFLLGSGAVALAMVAAWKGLPRVWNHIRVLGERNDLRAENDRLRHALQGATEALDAMEGIRAELRETRIELGRRIDELEETQIESARYIAALISHIRQSGSGDLMPPIPDRLRDDVLDALRQRTQG